MPDAPIIGRESRLIIVARVLRVYGDPTYPTGYDLEVTRAIKGKAPKTMTIPAVKVSVCDDKLGVRVNQTIVLAFDVPFADQVINIHWELNGVSAVVNGSGPHEQGMSLQQLEQSLQLADPGASAQGPPTAQANPGSSPPGSPTIPLATVAAAILLIGVTLGILWRLAAWRRRA